MITYWGDKEGSDNYPIASSSRYLHVHRWWVLVCGYESGLLTTALRHLVQWRYLETNCI